MNASARSFEIEITTGQTEIPITRIRIGQRVRKDMGDIEALAASIREHGLIHPPAITPDGTLIAGHRRVQACIAMGWSHIPVRVIEVAELLSAEIAENEMRKAFTPSEAVAIARMIEEPLKAQARAAKSARVSAQKKAYWAAKRGEKVGPVNLTEPTSKTSRTTAAQVVGLSDGAYALAKDVIEAAEQSPDQFSDIVERMDATGNIHAAHQELRNRRNKQPERHAMLRKMRHRDANREIERAITSLGGLAIGVERIDVKGLDAERVEVWSKELKKQVSIINGFVRRLNHEFRK